MKDRYLPKVAGLAIVATGVSALLAEEGLGYAKKNWTWILGFSLVGGVLTGGYAMYEGTWGIQNRPEDTGGVKQKPQNQSVTDKPKKAMYTR